MNDRSDDLSHHLAPSGELCQHIMRYLFLRHLTATYHFREREINVLFNDALNTFYLQLYGVRHMVKDHSDSEKGNPLPPHRLLFPINSKGSFICTIPRPLLHQSWSTGWVHPVNDRSDDPSHHERTLLPQSYTSLLSF